MNRSSGSGRFGKPDPGFGKPDPGFGQPEPEKPALSWEELDQQARTATGPFGQPLSHGDGRVGRNGAVFGKPEPGPEQPEPEKPAFSSWADWAQQHNADVEVERPALSWEEWAQQHNVGDMGISTSGVTGGLSGMNAETSPLDRLHDIADAGDSYQAGGEGIDYA